MNELLNKYTTEIAPKLKESLGLKNINQVPRLQSIHLNVGIGSYMSNSSDYSPILENVTKIAGQKPVVIKSKKSVSNFKLRAGEPNGIAVTLRKDRMYDFFRKLIHVVLPRVRDFRGISRKSFDGNGNYSFGIVEHTIFPEIATQELVKAHGLQITIKTSTRSDKEAFALLEAFGFPFEKKVLKSRDK